MGNNSSRESRGPESGSPRPRDSPDRGGNVLFASERPHLYIRNSGTSSRPDLPFISLRSPNGNGEVPERRETKQERDTRRLEKERVTRLRERERSIKEEHVDGGFLVTMGVYTGIENFSKPVVRQLMIERKIAPFWRGLDDFKEDWAEHQLIAAGRGQPIPAADEIPSEELVNTPNTSDAVTTVGAHSLMVPISGRSMSLASDRSGTASPGEKVPVHASQSLSPFRPRSKTLASLASCSSNLTSAEIVPRELQLPKDFFVNGQAIEVFLYKDARECPICFMYYPPYLNRTRCCDQPICSECFVQIKRLDPHPPEHEQNDPSNPAPRPSTEGVPPDSLVSEPAACPYCQQAEFGVTFEPPPFRRGLVYATSSGLAALSTPMPSSSSLASVQGPPGANRRRTTSVSANSSIVTTTDRIRPDWSTKLANARNHLARRAAAATALHTAAYLIGSGTNDSRSFGFTSRSRFSRRHGEDQTASAGTGTSSPSASDTNSRGAFDQNARSAGEDGRQGRRSRMEDLEEMMMMEAIRLSLAAEEERKRKADKEAAKEAKRKAKEEKQKEKRERRAIYGSGSNSASASVLSLSLPGIGRRRGNSGSSNLAKQITPEVLISAESKGKGVDRTTPSDATPAATPHMDFTRKVTSGDDGLESVRQADMLGVSNALGSRYMFVSSSAPDKPSHLRQISNTSSMASSFVDSPVGSFQNNVNGFGSSASIDSPGLSGRVVDGPHESGADTDATEPLYNFQSLVAMIGKDDGESEQGAAHIESAGDSSAKNEDGSTSQIDESVATLKPPESNSIDGIAFDESRRAQALLHAQRPIPELMITPVTPGAQSDDGKQLGSGWAEQMTREITQ